jgi:AcrR family transcriptional regulator
MNAYHHGALAEAMVDEALREVREVGPDDVSLRRIATTLGVSPSAAYNHFADKDALLHRVGECGHEDLDRRMAKATEQLTGDTDAAAIARFRALGEAYVAFAVEDPNLFRLTFSPLCFMTMDESKDSGPFQRLSDALDELQRRDLLRRGVRENLDIATWSTVHGMSLLILEGALPAEASGAVLDSIAQLVITDAKRTAPKKPARRK